MAVITKRRWWARGATGHRLRKVAWGYTAVLDGRQVRSFSEEWTKEDAEAALKEVQEILGHREFTMTLCYAHLSPDRLRDAVPSLEWFGARKAHGATLDPLSAAAAPQGAGKVDAPVAQLDRATVS